MFDFEWNEPMTKPPDDEGPTIVEPPFDPETDTKPLKPLSKPAGSRPELSLPGRIRRPPGTILSDALPAGGSTMRGSEPPAQDDTERVRLVPRLPDPPPWRLILLVMGDTTSTIGLDVRQMLVIGRSDPDMGEKPDLDLARHRAMEHGISRHHAALIPTNDALYLTDLDSTNGTWINGEFLQPGDRYPLQTGDEVELGLLRLTVKTVMPFQRSSG